MITKEAIYLALLAVWKQTLIQRTDLDTTLNNAMRDLWRDMTLEERDYVRVEVLGPEG